MNCPKCNFVMTDLDIECPRCHGKGLQKPTQQLQPSSQPIQPPSAGTPVQFAPNYQPPKQTGMAISQRNNALLFFGAGGGIVMAIYARDILAGLLIGGLLAGIVMLIWFMSQGTIQQRFISLNPLAGKTRAEIVARVGAPNSVSNGGRTLQWIQPGYHIVLIFDKNDICLGVTHEFSSGGLG